MVTSLTIGTLLLDPTIYLISEVQGLEDAERRTPGFNLPGQDGAFISNSLLGQRRVHIQGAIVAATPTIYLTKRAALLASLRFSRDANGLPIPVTTKFTLNSDSTQQYQFDGYAGSPVQAPYRSGEVSTGSFLIDLLAPDPMLYSQTVTTGTLTIGASGGTAIPSVIPASLTTGSSGGTITLNNTGNADSFPTITLTGPLTTPTITNQTTGKNFKLNQTLIVTDVVVIDMKNKTVTQGSTNQIGNKSDDSIWWSLQPGLNTISLGAQNSHSTESAVVSFRGAVVGV